jgi:8-oxo-dGTP diphosphatase
MSKTILAKIDVASSPKDRGLSIDPAHTNNPAPLGSLGGVRMVSAMIQQQNRYLIIKRRATGLLGGFWEFPSGKVASDETDEAALKREICEFVGVEVKVDRLKAQRTQHYADYSVDVVLYEASILPGQELRPLRAAEFRWVRSQDLEQYLFPPADQSTTDLLLDIKRG